MSLEFMLRLVGMVVLGVIGWELGDIAVERTGAWQLPYVLSLSGAAFGLLITPWITIKPLRRLGRLIRQIPTQHLLAGTIGLAVGLIISALLALPLSLLPGLLGSILPLAASILFGYLGILTAVTKEKDLRNMISSRFAKEAPLREGNYLILDTSVIIDGRIADISQTGFIEGTLLVPRFVLDELQHIADSSNTLRRQRGRRGLDILNKLQKDPKVPIQITDADVKEIREVDGKLVQLAKNLDCPIITNDYNLNRVAELQGVKVLNVNELANAVKVVLLPGESIKVRLIQEGKELGQGVGYLDDGTMVVVQDGRKYIGDTIEVTVTRILQTVAGRMIFAQPQPEKPTKR